MLPIEPLGLSAKQWQFLLAPDRYVQASSRSDRPLVAESTRRQFLTARDILTRLNGSNGQEARRGILLADDVGLSPSPCLQRPLERGFDLVMHSATKYLNGHSDMVGGLLVVGDNAELAERLAFLQNAVGGIAGPFDAFLALRGVKTLALRMARHCENAEMLAGWLERHPKVARVHYPGLASHPQHALAMAQQSGLGGAVLSFDVRGDSPEAARAAAFKVIDSTRVLSIATNLGDTKSIITHPATTSHGRLTEAQRQAAGIGQGLIRLAVGLEHVDDITDDLQRGLGAC